MATLVLNTVGTILGGPVGGAIGSLVGQSIDQQLFGTGARKGPRLGDLSVQTSSYGSAIPKVFGTMRVAGTIIWSTDLQEQSQTQSAKGQPDSVTYSYSVSFAVALSSREIAQVGRIWADGKLIRNAAGEFTVPTGFRVNTGSEDQPLDPLIASIEGLGSAPAYRGIALAIFENLQLADFGNRIPFLTFEVIADAQPPALGDVLSEISEGTITGGPSQPLPGYAAYGPSRAAAVEPLVSVTDVKLFDDGVALSPPRGQMVMVGEDETGCSADDRTAARVEKSQIPAKDVPSSISLSYYDPARDYQAGLARAALDRTTGSSLQLDLPAVMDAGSAKDLAETSLARRWAERDRLTLWLPPAFAGISPGTVVTPPGARGQWLAERITIDSLAVIVELRPVYTSLSGATADPGRVVGSTAVAPSPTSVAIVELPDDGSGSADRPVVAVAATSATGPWRPVALQIAIAGAVTSGATATGATVMGKALTVLGSGQSAVFDLVHNIDVELTRADDWLESRDDDALVAGENLALIGNELVQFGQVSSLGNGRFRLSRLLRGRRGTEWAMDSHFTGELLVMLDQSRLRRIDIGPGQVGASVSVTPMGMADRNASAIESLVTGEALSPPSPVRLRTLLDEQGSLQCTWVRRSNRGWTWLDNVEAPLGCSTELYRLTLSGSAGTVIIEATEPGADFTAGQLATAGSGPAVVSVVQVGDFAVSRPAATSITIS